MKRIVKIRIINSFLGIALLVVITLGLTSVFNSDGENRYWEGKAFGGSIAIIGFLLLTLGIIVIGTYKKTKSKDAVFRTLKEVVLIAISYDWLKPSRKKRRK